MHLTTEQWIIGALSALFVGVSKTGIPGVGILVVPLLAGAFGGRLGAGVMLPLLIMGDVFAVAWYRRHCQWNKLIGLLPWVVAGLVVGTATLWVTGAAKGSKSKDVTDLVIGSLVLIMLVVHLLRSKLGERLTPTSPTGVAGTGIAAGFSTMVSNAAGPVMQLYLSAHKLPKEQFMGTIAWYFFIINVSKMPVYWALSLKFPDKPMMTDWSLSFNAFMFPAILVGVFVGKWLLPRIPQKAFEGAVLLLTAIGAAHLVCGFFK